MSEGGVRELLERRKNRAIAIVLGVKERELDAQLTDEASRKLRKVVLDQFNDFSELCADLLESVGGTGGVVLNEHYLQKLDAIYEATAREDQCPQHARPSATTSPR